MPNIAKPKGSKDNTQNVEFVRYEHELHVSIDFGSGKYKSSKNIPPSEFATNYEVVSEENQKPKE